MFFPSWLRSLRLGSSPGQIKHSRLASGRRPPSRKLHLEVLEDRTLLSTFPVLNTSDSGTGSLRQAIIDANSTVNVGGPDIINFSMPANDLNHFYYQNDGVAGQVSLANVAVTTAVADSSITDIDPDYKHSWWSIKPSAALPTITDPVVIDGTTQPGFSSTPVIELSGANAGTGATGLFITAGNSTVRGLVINQFDSEGIAVFGGYANGNVIVGNYIGTDVSGTLKKGNGNPTVGGDGIGIEYGSNNIIGGEASSDCNLISGNSSAGVVVSRNAGNHILGNYIGTTASGDHALPNTVNGILLAGTTNNTIGGTTAGARNIISGNGDGSNGGYTRAANVDILNVYELGNNTVEGNYIGTSADGMASLGDANSIGVYITSGGNLIGGSVMGSGNVISGNGYAGIIGGGWIAGNYIGPNAAGTGTPTGQQQANGVGAGGLIGTNGDGVGDTFERNVISGNTRANLELGNDAVVAGNYIGTNAAGTALLGYSYFGILGTEVSGARIGINSADVNYTAERNVIVGTIFLVFPATHDNVIAGNYIGLNAAGDAALGGEIVLWYGPHDNRIEQNVISPNAGYRTERGGVSLYGSGTSNNTVAGNYIGINAAGDAAVGDKGNNVFVSSSGVVILRGASNNTIGGTTAAARNVISGNGGWGVYIQDAASTGNVVEGNYIGTNYLGDSKSPNDSGGVFINDAAGNTIGGATPGAGNVISGNNAGGAGVWGLNGTNNLIQGNFIGTNATGLLLGNDGPGVWLSLGANHNTIGGTSLGAGNVIGANTVGIVFDNYYWFGGGTPANTNLVQGNFIGTDRTGLRALGNSGDGIAISNVLDIDYGGTSRFTGTSAYNNTIGGTAASAGNIIANNGGNGVTVHGNGATGNSIRGNSIHDNSGLGIDLGGDGVTVNDSAGHAGSNNFQNFPVLTAAVTNGTSTTIIGTFNSGTLNGLPFQPNANIILDFYSDAAPDPSGYGQGQTFLGSATVTTDAAGIAGFTATLAATVAPGQFITTTATDAAGNTSEFSQAVLARAPLTVKVNSSLMLAGNSPPALTGVVNGSSFTGMTSYTTAYGDSVIVTLSTNTTSGSSVGQYAITAGLSGAKAADYFIDPATSASGTMYVVSIGADSTSTIGAESVVFWDNKGNRSLLTAADLSALVALNLVKDNGNAFDPKSVAELQAWLQKANATSSNMAYQLSMQLAVMDLDVLTGYVKTTDLVYAGGLLPYVTGYGLIGLTSGGFISIANLMASANAALLLDPTTFSGDPFRAYEAALTIALQAADNNSSFVQQEVTWNLTSLYQLLTSLA